MTIENFKQTILDKKVSDNLLIFVDKYDKFLCRQYYREIANQKKLSIQVIDDLSPFKNSNLDVFGLETTADILNIYQCEKFDDVDLNISKCNNLIIICDKISDEAKEHYNESIIEFPQLEEWQKIDYAMSLTEGVNEKQIEEIAKLCKDIYRIDNEVFKLNIFPENIRQPIFDRMKEDLAFKDLSDKTIFNFVDFIIKKDFNSAKNIYCQIGTVDITGMYLLTCLHNKFKSIINLQLNPKCTAESLGVSSGRFYYMKKDCNYYNRVQLIKIFLLITELDKKVKLGWISENNLVDYLLIKLYNI